MSEIFIPIISLWQPWANAIVVPHPKYPERGMKEYETRSWTTKVRGRILVHAAKKKVAVFPSEKIKLLDQLLDMHGGRLPVGAIVGSVEIVEIITSEKFHAEGPSLSKTPEDEFWWGDWQPNRFGWKLANPITFGSPIPCVGRQGFFKYPLSSLPEQYQQHFKQQ